MCSNSSTQTLLGVRKEFAIATSRSKIHDGLRSTSRYWRKKKRKTRNLGNSSNTNLVLKRGRNWTIKHLEKSKKRNGLVQRLVLFASFAYWREWGGRWRPRCRLQSLICRWKSSSLRLSALPVLSSRGLEPPWCTCVNRPTWSKDVAITIKKHTQRQIQKLSSCFQFHSFQSKKKKRSFPAQLSMPLNHLTHFFFLGFTKINYPTVGRFA